MRVVIVGNGVAGQTAAETLRKAEPNMEILIITEEPYSYYTRVFLPQYIANKSTLDQVILRKPEWYQQNNISLLLDARVTKIDPAHHQILIEDDPNPVSYDKLILATGATPRKLPFGNPNVHGMYTLRKVADADLIKADITDRKVKHVFIIGGGLLGIELGYNLRALGLDVTIC